MFQIQTLILSALLWHCVRGGLFSFICSEGEMVCPNKNVEFYLHTKETKNTPEQIDMFDEDSIARVNFIPNRPVVVFIHGYAGTKDSYSNNKIRTAYYQHSEYNYITVFYLPLAPRPCYEQAVKNAPIVANCTAQFLDTLMKWKKFKIDDVHIIGFSLGAQIAGMISNYLESGKLPRITGLDPAQPLFNNVTFEQKLDASDADFVDIIHTDAFRGAPNITGHADFYVNGGHHQPGCTNFMSLSFCSHFRAAEYYAETINTDVAFVGIKCNNHTILSVAKAICKEEDRTTRAVMGMHLSLATRGTYFVTTNSQSPYAKAIESDSNNLIDNK